MNPASLLTPRPAQRDAIRCATARLADARRSEGDRGTFASRLRTAPRSALLLLMALLPSAALLALKPQLMTAWHGTMLWWSERLALPMGFVPTGDTASLERQAARAGALLPDTATGVIMAAAVIGAFAATRWMSDRQAPLKYLVRTLCVVQAGALLCFIFAPGSFPDTLTGHLAVLLNTGFYLMLALPPLLALGLGVLRLPLHRRLLYLVLLMAYFAVMLPHKALLHAVVVQHVSALFLPMLSLCFGVVLDLMVVAALYAWLANLAPGSGNAR